MSSVHQRQGSGFVIAIQRLTYRQCSASSGQPELGGEIGKVVGEMVEAFQYQPFAMETLAEQAGLGLAGLVAVIAAPSQHFAPVA